MGHKLMLFCSMLEINDVVLYCIVGGHHEPDQGPTMYPARHESASPLDQAARQAVDRVLREHTSRVRQDGAARSRLALQGQSRVMG